MSEVMRPYGRVSRDRSGRSRSPEEQLLDLDMDAQAQAWTVGPSYVDEGSASRFKTSERTVFPALMKDLAEGTFNAGILGLWEGSRGSRMIEEWVDLVNVCAARKVRIWVHTHRRLYDPTNPYDRAQLLEDAVKHELSSEETSMRAKRAAVADARAGKPFGRVPYGYKRRYETEYMDGRQVKTIIQEPHEHEARVVRELFDLVAAGKSFRSIARLFNERGWTTRTGRAWTSEHLADLLTRRVYIGERTHHGQIHKGTWTPIVPRVQWLRVQVRLKRQRRKDERPDPQSHLVTMTARCDVCDGPLTALQQRGRSDLRCNNGHVRIAEAPVDEYVESVIFAYFARADAYQQLTASTGQTANAELDVVRNQIAELRAELAELPRRVRQRTMKLARSLAYEAELLPEIERLEKREQQLVTPTQIQALVPPGVDIRDHWRAAPIDVRRRIVRYLFTPEILGEIRITRARQQRPTKGSFGIPATPITDRIRLARSEEVAA